MTEAIMKKTNNQEEASMEAEEKSRSTVREHQSGSANECECDSNTDAARIEAHYEWQTQVREAAKGYGASGYRVFKLHSIVAGRCTCNDDDCDSPGKHPRIDDWQYKATADVGLIDPTWRLKPDSNIGIPTGQASGILVLDIDLAKVDGQPSGEDSLAELIRVHGELPETVEAITGSGGRHLIFQHPPYPLGNRISIMPGLDVKADGGYIVAPPSKHISGNTYRWKPGHGLGEIDLALAPECLLALIKEKSSGNSRSNNDWVQLAAECVPQSQRNQTLAGYIGHLLGKGIHPYVACELMLAWSEARCKPPMEVKRVINTINSIAGRELSKRKGEQK